MTDYKDRGDTTGRKLWHSMKDDMEAATSRRTDRCAFVLTLRPVWRDWFHVDLDATNTTGEGAFTGIARALRCWVTCVAPCIATTLVLEVGVRSFWVTLCTYTSATPATHVLAR